ncbi:MarR family winged helix-turn-helix transcriptional regulator [Thermoactinospora rubra]|uniref:MarR family winged helix-turn-helix transcriptional regulator n=1 Tax=Thermoactinospora rubra TaxID=1088767 RepID=UPI000A116D85|nr:MarR family transcriptional regulator [Thermoactinospora rubra]
MTDERDELIKRISETQRHLNRLFLQHRSPLFTSNLTVRQLHVVIMLAEYGTASGQDLAQRLGVSLGTVTGIVDRLIAHNLVNRYEDPRDRRVRRIELTDTGRALVREITDAGLARYRQIMQRLDLETLRALDHVTTKIREIAEDL